MFYPVDLEKEQYKTNKFIVICHQLAAQQAHTNSSHSLLYCAILPISGGGSRKSGETNLPVNSGYKHYNDVKKKLAPPKKSTDKQKKTSKYTCVRANTPLPHKIMSTSSLKPLILNKYMLKIFSFCGELYALDKPNFRW